MNAITSTPRTMSNSELIVDHLYQRTVFRGTLKVRDGILRIDRMKLDKATAMELGINNIGLFVENCPGFERMMEHIRHLDDCISSNWVVVPSSKMVKEKLVDFGVANNVQVATPEELSTLSTSMENLAGILIFDYACHIHKCRGSFSRHQTANDRPQKVVDFRMKFRLGDWSPPVFIFTNRKAISVNTEPMLSPYCLEAFRYIDGMTMRFGEITG